MENWQKIKTTKKKHNREKAIRSGQQKEERREKLQVFSSCEVLKKYQCIFLYVGY